jgi:uncharacterized protein (DUF1501 family)
MRHPAHPTRRQWLRSAVGAGITAGAFDPLATLALAAPTSPGNTDSGRFVLVILRGGLDGLYAVPAIGDPDFAAARGALGQYASAPLPLSGPFALHPNLTQLHSMFGAGEASVLHAAGLVYHERSHFDAQNVLESGGVRPFQITTGWLGRALGVAGSKGMALSTTVPLVLRGSGSIDTWAPPTLPDPNADLVSRLERMYGSDAALGSALARAKALHFDATMMAELNGGEANGTMNAAAGAAGAAGAAAKPGAFVTLAQRAAEFLSQREGPRVAVLELSGWDSHANEAAPNGATANNLRNLDNGLAALRAGLVAGNAWRDTAVVVATEFGREVAINGTLGTDHGSGGAAFLLGGAIQGGKVIADWPGLAKKDRFEGRDLRTTTDLRAVLKGVLQDRLRIAGRALDSEVFPGSETVKPLAVMA